MFKDFGHMFGGTMKSAFSRAFPFHSMKEMCRDLDEYSPVAATGGVVPVKDHFTLLIRQPTEPDRRRGNVTVTAVESSSSSPNTITIDSDDDPEVFRKDEEYVIVVSGDATITVPKTCDSLTVSLFDGEIAVNAPPCKSMLHTMNGDIQAEGLILERGCTTLNGNICLGLVGAEGDSVAVTTLNGDIELILPVGYDGEVRAETMSGSINFDLPDSDVTDSERRIGSGVVFRLGSGDGPRIENRTLSGDIEIQTAGARRTENRAETETDDADTE